MIWKCNDCKDIFDEPRKTSESGAFWGVPYISDYYVCPFCRSDDIEEYHEEEEEDDEEEEEE